LLTVSQIEFYNEFQEIGLGQLDRGNDFTNFAPRYQIWYPSDLTELRAMYALRIRNPEQLSKERLESDIRNQLVGGLGESVGIHLFKSPIPQYLEEFNNYLPNPAIDKKGGDPGYDCVHRGQRMDFKTTPNTFNGFSFPYYYKSIEQKCDYFVFNRWIPQHHHCIVLGFAPWDLVIANLKPIQNPRTGRWFLDLSLGRLYDSGILETNIYKLVNI
jgi:hypothetical protein